MKAKQWIEITTFLASFLFFTACSAMNNSIEKSSIKNRSVAVGEVSEQLVLSNFPIFKKGFQQYQFTNDELKIIASWPTGLRVDTFFGTWCHDSQREVPKLLKLLTHRQDIRSRLIGLDGYKKDPEGFSISAGVTHTPTFIIELNGKEIGRIIERPQVSIVSDINRFIVAVKKQHQHSQS